MTEKITYTRNGDFFLPELAVPEREYVIGKYGMLRRAYLKNHRRSMYSILLTNGKLLKHLSEIDKTATEQVERIVSQMADAEGVTEKMKEEPMRWIGLMNNFKNSAEELILSELVYS